MPFDPSLPAANAPIVSNELRNQFNGLNDLIAQRTTLDEVNDAIATGSAAPITVAPLNLAVANPPTQAQVQAIVTKLNALIAALTRPPAWRG